MDQPLYRAILKRAGLVLLAVGSIDIGWMIYSIVNGISYSSSLNIFAVIAGILLIRGGLKTAGFVRWFALFFLSALLALAVTFPLLQPIGLTLAEIRFDTGSVIVSIFFTLLIGAFLYWISTELGRESIHLAREDAGLKRTGARVPMACGAGAVLLACVMLIVFLNGESAERAKIEAAKVVGPGYSLHITSLSVNYSGRRQSGSAVVAAWNNKEVRHVPVHWEEPGN